MAVLRQRLRRPLEVQMPRKRPSRTTIGDMPTRGLGDRDFIPDEELIRCALSDIVELSALPTDVVDKLTDDLLHALGYYQAGVNVGKRGISNDDIAREIFVKDLFRALERAGFRATRWRKKYDWGEVGDESLSFRVIRSLFDKLGIRCPEDLKRIAQRAADINYL
jgi:hypothetical protein